ncbi:MAG: hypothetical protein IJ560_02820 [Alphaproteobacteria bacterium]|nr:hypothetical protein [Alphaproteobacteria bacterium]
MIDIKSDTIFSEIGGGIAAWVPSDVSGGDLAAATASAVEMGCDLISVAPSNISVVWPWLEHKCPQILARFYLKTDATTMDAAISELAINANAAFKAGACGVQVFLSMADLAVFCRQIHIVRDDLFFNKKLCVGIDISEIGSGDWGRVFDSLSMIRADAIVLALARDTGGKSDFVGRIYGMLNTATTWNGAFHFTLGNNLFRIEQVWRLILALRPGIARDARFFVTK